MPTGFGLNPMVTVVANALRVGTWIVEQSKSGDGLTWSPGIHSTAKNHASPITSRHLQRWYARQGRRSNQV